MRLTNKLLGLIMLVISPVLVLAESSTLTLYGLELGGQRSIQQQLGVGQQSFFLEDANLLQQTNVPAGRERAEHQIACKQTSFGIAKVLSETYQNLSAKDEYLSARKELLNRRIKEDIAAAQTAIFNSVSKKYAQPECSWAFNSAIYADTETPAVVAKFKKNSGIDKLATLRFTVNHKGQLLALSAEQLVERLDTERLDAIIAAIAKRYQLELEPISNKNKSVQKKILEGKQVIEFAVAENQCQLLVKNTYYRSEAASRYFGIEEAHGYIEMGCEMPAYQAFNDTELQNYVTSQAEESVLALLNKHKTQMKSEGQKEKNSGFVF